MFPQDSLVQLPRHPVDSVVEPQLLGDVVTPIIQLIFQQPPWVMWGGVAVALLIVFLLLRRAWPHRGAATDWLRTRSRGVKTALVGTVAVVILAALGAGYSGYHFVETDARFCNGCHIFVPSGQSWAIPDTGAYTLVPKLEGKHDTINCHTCHPLKPFKEAIKLTLWMSGVRGDTIPEHGKVPRTICEQCHVQGVAKERWQAIAATAGHRVHFESDSSALADKKECLTCHARTAHRFAPPKETCGQSGCHEESDTRITLTKMSEVSDIHCVACHNFTADVPALATRDSAAGTLRPNLEKCFACHEMKERLPDFELALDPHSGTCGMCHDPHLQTRAEEAVKTCASANCHADWRKEPFHINESHRKVAHDCLTCHPAHSARVDASNCAGCHEAVRAAPGTRRMSPPLPFDTTKALRQSIGPEVPEPPLDDPPAKARGDIPLQPADSPAERESKVKGDAPPAEPAPLATHGFQEGRAPPGDDPPWREVRTVPPLPSDTFSHDQHKKQACITCHVTATGKGRLTFEQPRGCQICHHQAPARSKCGDCHADVELAPTAVAVTVEVRNTAPRARDIGFSHDTHDEASAKLRCQDCHAGQVDFTAPDSVRSCQGCHVQHHETGRDCATCHRTDAIVAAHERPAGLKREPAPAHERCDACHDRARIQDLQPARSFCLACHEPEVDHYPPRECSDCHLQSAPSEWKLRLVGGRAR